MPLEIVRNDLIKMNVDAIVNPTNPWLFSESGLDGKIHSAAGPKLKEATSRLGKCGYGQAKLTKGYDLPAKHVIHAVGPVWNDGLHGEEKLLEDCYRNSLDLVLENNLESVAFPIISSGINGYPKEKALSTAMSVLGDFLLVHDITIYLVVYDRRAFRLSSVLTKSVKQYIDDYYVQEHTKFQRSLVSEVSLLGGIHYDQAVAPPKRSLEDVVNNLGETFSHMLIRLIDEKGYSDPDVYKRANVDRKHFSKIRSNMNYHPKRKTVLAFSIALELSLDETEDLMMSAGYAFSYASKFDKIVKFCIENGEYNIFKVIEALFAMGESTLGA